MNTDLTPKEAKEILSLLKQGFNLSLGGNAPAGPKLAPDYLGGGGAGGKRIMSGLKGLGQDIASGVSSAATSVGNAVSGAAKAVGDGFNKVMTPPAGNPNMMGQMTAGMAGARVPSMTQAAPAPVQPKAPSAANTPIGPFEKGPTPMAPQPQGSQSLSTAPITPVPVSRGVENPAMQTKPPTLADRGVTPAPQAPAPAPQFSGAVTDQERQLLRKLHASDFNPNSKRDQQMLEHLRAAGREAGGYDDFKNLRNLAYANQYGAKSDYGMLAQKWRDGRAQQIAQAEGMPIKSSAEYTTLTRRNTGVTTTEGNVWINPADREWLSKTAAYQDVSWEDYCNLDPDDEPKSIISFFETK